MFSIGEPGSYFNVPFSHNKTEHTGNHLKSHTQNHLKIPHSSLPKEMNNSSHGNVIEVLVVLVRMQLSSVSSTGKDAIVSSHTTENVDIVDCELNVGGDVSKSPFIFSGQAFFLR